MEQWSILTYLGKTGHKESQDKLKAEESFPISENGYILGRLLAGMKCQLLLDTGANKSFMSKFILYVLQVTAHITKICCYHTENTSGKWTVC